MLELEKRKNSVIYDNGYITVAREAGNLFMISTQHSKVDFSTRRRYTLVEQCPGPST